MENQERLSESNVQFKSASENSEVSKIDRVEKTAVKKPESTSGRLYRISRTLRVVELLVVVTLLVLTIHIVAGSMEDLLKKVAGILLIALFSTYSLIVGVDILNRMKQRSVPDAPMFLFAVIGFLLFAAAAEGVYVLRYRENSHALLLVLIVLCIIEALLFLLDVTLLILSWRRAYMKIDKCPFGSRVSNGSTIYKPGDNYSQRTIPISDPLIFRHKDVHDVTTSISDYQRVSHPDLDNLHKYRKIGVGHRRQYVDRPVSAQPAVHLGVADVQTDPPEKKAVSDVESLIVPEVSEEPAQTMPKCPVCANHWDPHGSFRRPDNFGLCPTFLHLAQGFGMCNCSLQPPSSVFMPIPVELHAESASATDLGVTGKAEEKRNSRRDSSRDRQETT